MWHAYLNPLLRIANALQSTATVTLLLAETAAAAAVVVVFSCRGLYLWTHGLLTSDWCRQSFGRSLNLPTWLTDEWWTSKLTDDHITDIRFHSICTYRRLIWIIVSPPFVSFSLPSLTLFFIWCALSLPVFVWLIDKKFKLLSFLSFRNSSCFFPFFFQPLSPLRFPLFSLQTFILAYHSSVEVLCERPLHVFFGAQKVTAIQKGWSHKLIDFQHSILSHLG